MNPINKSPEIIVEPASRVSRAIHSANQLTLEQIVEPVAKTAFMATIRTVGAMMVAKEVAVTQYNRFFNDSSVQ